MCAHDVSLEAVADRDGLLSVEAESIERGREYSPIRLAESDLTRGDDNREVAFKARCAELQALNVPRPVCKDREGVERRDPVERRDRVVICRAPSLELSAKCSVQLGGELLNGTIDKRSQSAGPTTRAIERRPSTELGELGWLAGESLKRLVGEPIPSRAQYSNVSDSRHSSSATAKSAARKFSESNE